MLTGSGAGTSRSRSKTSSVNRFQEILKSLYLLLISQRDHWIHLRRRAGRYVTSHERHAPQY
jgi:hypothetical protein